MLRRAFIDDFDVQLAIRQVQQAIVERGRVLLERTNGAVIRFYGSLFGRHLPPSRGRGSQRHQGRT